jgi:undecaprenyl-diphosphatase
VSKLIGWLAQPESRLLGAVISAVAVALAFIKLASEVVEGETDAFDEWALRAARRHIVGSADSTAAEIALNITALGGYPVLALIVAFVVGFLLLQRKGWQALYVAAATAGGALLSDGLKGLFARPRPELLDPLVSTSSWSFPSGHALVSAVVYLTLGSLVAAAVPRRRAKLYVLSVAFVLAGLIGLSRVALRVHYPSDVLAGWLAGLAWALACWVVLELLERRRARARIGQGQGHGHVH